MFKLIPSSIHIRIKMVRNQIKNLKKTLINDNHYHNLNLNQIHFFIIIICIKNLIF